MPKPVAVWNSARDVWETPQTEGFFCEHLDVFLGTFPTSGMTVNGAAYELPTWEPATDASASSSLLLTPVASEGEKATFQQGSAQRSLTGQPFLTNQIRDVYDLNAKLLPTPEAKLGSSGPDYAKAARGSGGNDLQTTVAIHLLRTPCAAEAEGGPRNPNRPGATMRLSDQIREQLLPTPTVGMMLGGSQTRSGDRSGEMLLPGVAKQIGESTSQPSDAGNEPSDGQLRGQLNLLDAITDTD